MNPKQEDPHRYEDMLDLPHPVSRTHPPMPVKDRAAQFSPFAALTGYEETIRETERRTEERRELDEDEKAILNGKLRELEAHLDERPEVTLTCFRPDEKKAGGAYVTVTGRVRRIDRYERRIRMEDGESVRIRDIVGLEGTFSDGEPPQPTSPEG